MCVYVFWGWTLNLLTLRNWPLPMFLGVGIAEVTRRKLSRSQLKYTDHSDRIECIKSYIFVLMSTQMATNKSETLYVGHCIFSYVLCSHYMV